MYHLDYTSKQICFHYAGKKKRNTEPGSSACYLLCPCPFAFTAARASIVMKIRSCSLVHIVG